MTALSDRLARRAELEAEAGPLRERLARCDQAIAAMDEAQALRDTLLDQHDRLVADAIQYGRHPPEIDPGLNLAEIALRKASGEARAAAKARPGIVERLDAITAQQGQLAQQLEEQTWSDADAATAPLFERAEADTAALRCSLARIQSVSRHAYETAHTPRPGLEPTQHPAFRFWLRNEARLAMVRSLGPVEPDYETGPQLLRAVSEGRALLGDVSRWTPASVALPDGTGHLNLPVPGQEPGQPEGRQLLNPAEHPDEAWREFNNPVWESPLLTRRVG
jgi:hypothetical protein